MNPGINLEIGVLEVTVRVRAPERAPLAQVSQSDAPRRSREQVLLAPPPQPVVEDRGEVTAAQRHEPEGWSAADIDVQTLAERVYEQMLVEARVGHDRAGRII